MMNLRQNPIYLRGERRPTRSNALSHVGTVLFIGLLVIVNYFVFLRDDSSQSTPSLEHKINKTTEQPAVPVPVESPERPQVPISVPPIDDPSGAVLAGKLRKGETVIEALRKLGAEGDAVKVVVREMEKVFDFRTARVGDQFALIIDGRGKIAGLDLTTSPTDKYQVRRDEDGWIARKIAVPVDIEIARIGCTVKTSLYDSIKRCGEDPALAARLVDLFAWDIDFFQDVQRGDEVRLMVEKKHVDGQFLAYGNLVAVEYVGKAGTARAFWYEDETSDVRGYFTDEGQALKKEFLKTPLKYTRISSDYSHNRYHPVLHKYQKHLGVDYAAPVGAPVWAVASGTVTFVGTKGANGNLVAIQHANGYTSYYAHLSKFAKGLEVGDLVDQKTEIGYVGQTGRATGPHLHFALKHNDRFVNPQKIKFAMDNPIPPELIERFMGEVGQRLEQLQSIPVQDIEEKRS